MAPPGAAVGSRLGLGFLFQRRLSLAGHEELNVSQLEGVAVPDQHFPCDRAKGQPASACHRSNWLGDTHSVGAQRTAAADVPAVHHGAVGRLEVGDRD